MKIFFVAYDLVGAKSDEYTKLDNKIKERFKNNRKVQESLWSLKVEDTYTCKSLKEELLKLIDNNNKLLVIQPKAFSWEKYIEPPYKFRD